MTFLGVRNVRDKGTSRTVLRIVQRGSNARIAGLRPQEATVSKTTTKPRRSAEFRRLTEQIGLTDEQATAVLSRTVQPPKKKAAKKVTAVAVDTKAPAKRKARKAPATKGGQAVAKAGGSLKRKDWNRALTTKARLAGSADGVSVYSRVMADWDDIAEQRLAGKTPDEVLAQYV